MIAWLRARKSLLEHISATLLIGLALSILCLWAFVHLISEVFREQETQLDQAVANAVHAAATPDATRFFLTATMLGFQVLWGIGVLVGLYFLLKRQWIRLGVWIVALAGGEALDFLLKLWFNRPRPYFADPIAVALYSSFPSGHATMSVITYGLLIYFANITLKRAWMRVVSSAALILIVLLIGVSRIYLGVHYLTDVLAGFAMGGLWLIFCVSALNYLLARQARRHPPTQAVTSN
ncbi:MAG TPA: phosphatase PAP2 family protein [Phototrophicaceae bacterium]|nr:phosphatase PAP2 family protein [Phototrophicaceae bacterium]